MRGTDQENGPLFSYVSMEDRIPKDHPLRPIRKMVNRVLVEMYGDFSQVYSSLGRPSIPPERLLRALVLQVLYSIRSERILVEQLDYNLLFRWFVGLGIDDKVWNHAVFSKNRDRFLASDLAHTFFAHVKKQAEDLNLLSDEHFTVDGTLIEAWASMKSVREKAEQDRDQSGPGGRNPSVDFHGSRRKNETHASTTDPEARMYRKGKGKETKLTYMGHALMENRNGLCIDTRTTLSTGTAEVEAAEAMVEAIPGSHQITVGADKGYDTAGFVKALREAQATPHIAQNTSGRNSNIDGRTTRHEGYSVSQRTRKRVEEIFGWMKVIANMRKVKHRGKDRVGWQFTFAAAVYNLVRMRNLAGVT